MNTEQFADGSNGIDKLSAVSRLFPGTRQDSLASGPERTYVFIAGARVSSRLPQSRIGSCDALSQAFRT
jgi:hypothetical protein